MMMTQFSAPQRASVRFGFLMREQVAARHLLMALEKHGVKALAIWLDPKEAFDKLHIAPYPPDMPEAQQKQLRQALEQALDKTAEVTKTPDNHYQYRRYPVEIHLAR